MNSETTEYSATNREMATYYASRGYYIFPCHSVRRIGDVLSCTCREGLRCSRSAKHPRTRHGVKDASNEPSMIHEWWSRWPEANIGIATGRRSGIFVLDVDPRKGGEFSLETLEDQYKLDLGDNYESASETLISRTGGGGRHLVFRYPDKFPIKSSQGLIGRGLDVCSDGSFIIAPPSMHKSGNRYRWHGAGIETTNVPKWLLYEILRTSSRQQPAARVEGSIGSDVGSGTAIFREGARNDFLFKKCCGLVHSFSSQEVRRRIGELNNSRCSPPLENEEIDKLLGWVERNYRGT